MIDAMPERIKGFQSSWQSHRKSTLCTKPAHAQARTAVGVDGPGGLFGLRHQGPLLLQLLHVVHALHCGHACSIVNACAHGGGLTSSDDDALLPLLPAHRLKRQTDTQKDTDRNKQTQTRQCTIHPPTRPPTPIPPANAIQWGRDYAPRPWPYMEWQMSEMTWYRICWYHVCVRVGGGLQEVGGYGRRRQSQSPHADPYP